MMKHPDGYIVLDDQQRKLMQTRLEQERQVVEDEIEWIQAEIQRIDRMVQVHNDLPWYRAIFAAPPDPYGVMQSIYEMRLDKARKELNTIEFLIKAINLHSYISFRDCMRFHLI